jgi:hypothetical protein
LRSTRHRSRHEPPDDGAVAPAPETLSSKRLSWSRAVPPARFDEPLGEARDCFGRTVGLLLKSGSPDGGQPLRPEPQLTLGNVDIIPVTRHSPSRSECLSLEPRSQPCTRRIRQADDCLAGAGLIDYFWPVIESLMIFPTTEETRSRQSPAR